MRFSRLLIKSLKYYLRTNISVAAAIAVCCAVLTGALIVGDSVDYSLKAAAEQRLGKIDLAMIKRGGFFTENLVGEIEKELDARVCGIVYLKGSVSVGNEERQANQVNIYAIDDEFFKLFGDESSSLQFQQDSILVNDAVAERLAISEGESLIVTADRPSQLPVRSALADKKDRTVSFRGGILSIVDKNQFGRFGLSANQSMPLNVFISKKQLQKETDLEGKVNICLVAAENNAITTLKADEAIRKHFSVEDLGLVIERDKSERSLRITSESVFIDKKLAEKVMSMKSQPTGILTYFVNSIESNGRLTPYSMVSAATRHEPFESYVPEAGGQEERITLTKWLADDLGAEISDEVTISYYVLTEDFRLEQEESLFRVSSIIPMHTAGLEPELMPDFPGFKDAENCGDWSSPVPLDFSRIRDKDERYWDKYRGTPKALINLDTALKLWAGKHGSLTEIRIDSTEFSSESVSEFITSNVDPAGFGLFFINTRRNALSSARGSTDFGQLFLGLSMFLIFSSVILIALTFSMGVENRAEQIGILKATGLTAGNIRKLFLMEGLVITSAAVLLGPAVAIFYTKSVIWALVNPWSGAIGGSDLVFHAEFSSILTGIISTLLISMLVICHTCNKMLKNSVSALLSGIFSEQFMLSDRSKHGTLISRSIYLLCFIVSLVMVFAGVINPDFSAGAFFTAGGLLLVCLIFLTLDIFNSVITTGKFVLTNDFSLAVKNSGKRKSRSLSVIILISCGTFMITAVGINGNMTVSEPGSRKSGTGGFEVYARSSIGITENLNTDKGRREAGINFSEDLQVRFINCRLHEGDNASCLNLNRPSRPSVMSVEHKKLAELEAFSFNRTIKDAGNVNPWELLEDSAPNDEVIPSIADHSTVMWSLGKKVGDFIEYRNQTGVNLKLKIVATVKNSILQGSIIVSDDSFVRNFPGDSEYRVFLADVEPLNEDNINKVSNILASRLVDYGLQATSTRKRLSMFNSVQNTYISIFELLGALGIILGTVAMGFIVMRNVLARMGELAMMWAIGYNIKKIRRIIFYEHMILFVYGSFTGLAASLVSVYPSLSVSGRDIPYLSITTTLIAIIVSASVWTLLATRLALKKNPLAALRNE